MNPQPSPLLVLDEDAEFNDTVARRFQRRGFVVRNAASIRELEAYSGSPFEICLMRLGFHTEGQIDQLQRGRLIAPHCQVVLLASREQLENAADSIPSGVADCLSKPLVWGELDWRIARAQDRALAARCDTSKSSDSAQLESPVEHHAHPAALSSAGALGENRVSADKADSLALVQRAHIVEVLRREGGNKARAARALGVNRRSLYRLIEKFKIEMGTTIGNGH